MKKVLFGTLTLVFIMLVFAFTNGNPENPSKEWLLNNTYEVSWEDVDEAKHSATMVLKNDKIPVMFVQQENALNIINMRTGVSMMGMGYFLCKCDACGDWYATPSLPSSNCAPCRSCGGSLQHPFTGVCYPYSVGGCSYRWPV